MPTSNSEELLQAVLETEESLASTEVHMDTLNAHLATLVGGPEYTRLHSIIEEINVEKKKLKVTVKIFGRKTPVELSFTQVEKE